MSLKPIGSEFTVDYFAADVNKSDSTPARIIVRWRVVSHELNEAGELIEVLSAVAVFRRDWQPIARPFGPQERKG